MSNDASNVIVAGTGDVYVAAAETALTGIAVGARPTSGWDQLGYISEDGASFNMDRSTEEIKSWQSMDPIRIVTTEEPKTISFELMQFDPVSFDLAMQGGTLTAGVWEPPVPGTQDYKAMVIYGLDGDYDFRFYFPKVQVTGAVEFNMNKADAIRLPLEFKVLASDDAWFFESNHPAWND